MNGTTKVSQAQFDYCGCAKVCGGDDSKYRREDHLVHPTLVEVGMPATYGIGSDSYGGTVTGVVRFKSGARKGEINYVEAFGLRFHIYTRPAHIYEGRVVEPERVYLATASKSGGRHYQHLAVGFARDYRDPSF